MPDDAQAPPVEDARAQIIEAAKQAFIREKCKGPHSGPALIADILFEGAKRPDSTAARNGLTREQLVEAVQKRLDAARVARFYGRDAVDRDITRLGERLAEARSLFFELGLQSVAGPTGALRDDGRDELWLDVELRDKAWEQQIDAPTAIYLQTKHLYDQLSPEEKRAADRKARRGLPGAVLAFAAIVATACAAALYYVRTSHVTTFAVTIRTPQETPVTIVRWDASRAVHPPFEILKNGRVIGTSTTTFFIDKQPVPHAVYRVAARWHGLKRATSGAAVPLPYAQNHMQPCTAFDNEGNGMYALCVPRFSPHAFLSEPFPAFTTPLDFVGFWGMVMDHSAVSGPKEHEGDVVDLSRDVLRIRPGDGSTFDPGILLQERVQYRQTGRFPFTIRAKNGDLYEGDRFIRVFDSGELPQVTLHRASDGAEVTARSSFEHAVFTPLAGGGRAAVVDVPHDYAVDVVVELPETSPFIPLAWEGVGPPSQQLELAPVPGSSPPRYTGRLHAYKAGPFDIHILGRKLVFDRTPLGTISMSLAARRPLPEPRYTGPVFDLSRGKMIPSPVRRTPH